MTGNVEEAIRIFQSVIEEDPVSYPEAHNKLATCHFMMGHVDDSLASTRRAIAVDPSHDQAWSVLGLLHFEKGDYQQAMGYFRKSLAIDPWSPVTSKLSACVDFVNQAARRR
jgi:tetratricopeptide (TPR) repeat protein